jgi:hypothetical protein
MVGQLQPRLPQGRPGDRARLRQCRQGLVQGRKLILEPREVDVALLADSAVPLKELAA